MKSILVSVVSSEKNVRRSLRKTRAKNDRLRAANIPERRFSLKGKEKTGKKENDLPSKIYRGKLGG